MLKKIVNNKFILILISSLALHIMNFYQSQESAWISPYLSAASNFDFSSWSMKVDVSQMREFAMLSSEEKFSYNFPNGNLLTDYDYLAKGFLFIVIFSKMIFPFLGDLQSVQLLQGFTHIIFSLIIINLLKKDYQKWLFVILYMLNPFILYFVNFPYYYFWQFIPSVIFLIYFLANKKIGNGIFILSIIFIFIYITRPTVLLFVLFFYVLYGYREGWIKSILGIILFSIFITAIPKYGFGPWHTAYVGIGAYDNKYEITTSDNDGYDYFKSRVGKTLNSSTITNKKLRSEYYEILKNRYLSIAKESPSLLIRNALFNILQSYSLGYETNRIYLSYIISFLGLIFIMLLLYTKQYLLFFAIGLSSIGFTPYYPPIPAYMFGSYSLLTVGFIFILDYFFEKNK
jgi:hypothetical protein